MSVLVHEPGGSIGTRQTTFWDLTLGQDRRLRLHFSQKLEFWFETERFAALEIVDEHPLLIDYTEAWVSLSFRGQPTHADATARAIDDAIREVSGGWRRGSCYLNRCMPPSELLRSGRGVITECPESYGTRVAHVLRDAGCVIQAQSLGSRATASKLALMGRSYVIARDFRLQWLADPAADRGSSS